MNDDIIYEILKFLPLKDKFNFCCVSKQIKNQYKLYKKQYFITNLNYTYLKKIFIKWKNLIYKKKKKIINSWSPKNKAENSPILLF